MTFEEYLQELADPPTKVRVSGLVRLSQLTPEQAEAFLPVWRGLGVRRRRRVIRELVDLVEDDVEVNFDAVFLAALDDEDAGVRLEAVGGLWEYEKPDLIGVLLRILEADDEAAVRAQAALALGRFVLLSELGKLRERYFQEVETGLRRALDKNGEIEEVRARALEAIGPHNSPWVRQAIREAYESGVRGLKVSAVHAMGRSCQARWLPLLLRELSNEDAEVRYEAALACGSLGDERAVTHLAPLLSDRDLEVKSVAIAALGDIGGRQARSILLELRGDPSPGVRDAATDALAEIDFSEDPLSFRQRF
ncbi:MAG: HEAT repeat domain-containing protein [Chloroflexi bacterium]|nr:HEAT repeat domain-containing protein [Chloroflexota bacterium]